MHFGSEKAELHSAVLSQQWVANIVQVMKEFWISPLTGLGKFLATLENKLKGYKVDMSYKSNLIPAPL